MTRDSAPIGRMASPGVLAILLALTALAEATATAADAVTAADATAGSGAAEEPRFSEAGAFHNLTLDQAVAALGDRPGTIAMGRMQFQQRCARCHVLEEGKPSIGPYLGLIADLKNRADLLKTILFPAADIALGYEVQRYTLADGRTYDGSVYEDSADLLRIATTKGDLRSLAKHKIASQEGLGTTLMPANVAQGMNVDQMASLITFLGTMNSRSQPPASGDAGPPPPTASK